MTAIPYGTGLVHFAAATAVMAMTLTAAVLRAWCRLDDAAGHAGAATTSRRAHSPW